MERILIVVAYTAMVAMANDEVMSSHRQLDELPEGISVCDEFFFGREASTPVGPLPFCVNNGICKSSWVRQVDQPCDCLEGFAGPHCEFKSGNVPAVCHLDCRNDGVCKIGAPTWQHYSRNTGGGGWTNPLDFQHCSCPAGYTGILCELKGSPCGDSHCHHGGKCIQKAQSDGSTKFYCDCSNAKNSDGDVAYAGQYCEHEATSFCSQSPTDNNGNHFCVNGGSCQAESYLGCTCQEGYVGPVCEFEDQGEVPEECSLTCENHGICRKGAKDVSTLTHEVITDVMKTAFNDDFEHCVCPSGYIGLKCEYQLDRCPGGSHVCLNGGECVTAPNGTQLLNACDCTNAETDTLRYAGAFCEMESTQFCTIDKGKSHADDGLSAFCTNGGTCLDFVPYGQKHPGCACLDGYGGENCQYHVSKNKSSKVAGAVGGFFAAAIVVVIVWLLLRYRRRRELVNSYGKKSLPPTLDIIRSLGHDREAEYTDVAMVVADKSSTANVYNNYTMDNNIVVRKTYWPSASYDGPNAIQVYKDVADDEEIRFSRKTYWPNDSHNDASNPIHIFDDISVRSDIEDSVSITNFTEDDDDNDDSIGISSYDDKESRYKSRGRII